MTAGVACGSCGTALRESAKFCDECGAATAVSGDTAKFLRYVLPTRSSCSTGVNRSSQIFASARRDRISNWCPLRMVAEPGQSLCISRAIAASSRKALRRGG
jgi:hypothetical protein